MLHSPGYGRLRRRRRGVLTHRMMTVLGAALLLGFHNPASGAPGAGPPR
jgi:hypothetical protein